MLIKFLLRDGIKSVEFGEFPQKKRLAAAVASSSLPTDDFSYQSEKDRKKIVPRRIASVLMY